MRSIKPLFFAAAALALVSGPVSVRAADPSPAAPAHAGQTSEASVRQLLEVMHVRTMVGQMMQQMGQMMGPMMDAALKGSPDTVTDAERTEMTRQATKIFQSVMAGFTYDKLEPIYVKVYTQTFSQTEIDGMAAFYRTPVGQSALAKMPQVMQRSMVELQPMLGQMMQDVQTQVQQYVADYTAKHAPAPKAG